MLKIKGFLVVLMFLFLTGCSHQFNERYLVRHPMQLRAIVDQCHAMGKILAQSNPSCAFAEKVYNAAIESEHIWMVNPQDLGRTIITSQLLLIALEQKINTVQQQLALTKENVDQPQLLQRLNQQYKDLNLKINVMVTFVAIREGM